MEVEQAVMQAVVQAVVQAKVEVQAFDLLVVYLQQ
jgi:hypothetical protein